MPSFQAVGRKNWLFTGSDEGAKRMATFYSPIGSCHLQGIDPYAYLKDVLEILVRGDDVAYDELTPSAWKKRQYPPAQAEYLTRVRRTDSLIRKSNNFYDGNLVEKKWKEKRVGLVAASPLLAHATWARHVKETDFYDAIGPLFIKEFGNRSKNSCFYMMPIR